MSHAVTVEEQVVAVVQSEGDRSVEIIVEGVRVIERLGSGGDAFDYVQATPSTAWTIAHNRGVYLTPRTFTVGGVEMVGATQHLSNNVVIVSFLLPVAGFARLA